MSRVDSIVKNMQIANLPSCYWTDTKNLELPELETAKLIMQRNNQSVWEHTMAVIDLLTIKNHITLLSGLFHDLGKTFVIPMDDVSLPRFPGHASESARTADNRLSEWGANPYLIDRVVRLVSTHMFDISNAIGEKTIRNFVADVGQDNVSNWFVLRVADSRSYAQQQKYRNKFIEPFRKRVMSYLEQQPSANQSTFEQSREIGPMEIRGVDNR